ncbi:ABC-2 type transport system ATP-binding protein [Amphibacillus marinus]|uniref:ABC-2 type transport system ATP-binding protein n=1 Tax=Amphibacillus marinus TaxID=872970 RepID=A0A1H8KGN1_9BACI|nr:ABC transporter ATP-binding protein [Amphibacillus marinus]SEN92130.1 ABC-2 type transport system ATP-binding protein [Amphibacillus marinus]
MTIIHLKDVTKRYKKQVVINEVNLKIERPGIWALVGPNGVGKTTLLNCICNIVPISSGTITLLGKSHRSYHVFKQIAFLQDNSILFHYLTGYDHLKYVADSHQVPKSNMLEVAEYLGMSNYLFKRVEDYSLGMKQHLLVALSLINKPKLLLMDEPLNGLDPTSAILIRNILLDLVKQGTTVILSSHNLAEIDRVTNQIIFLKNGKLFEVNRSDYLTTRYLFKVSNAKKAKKVLTEARYQVNDSAHNLDIEISEQDLDQCIKHIHNSNITILDIQKQVSSSEALYQDYYSEVMKGAH